MKACHKHETRLFVFPILTTDRCFDYLTGVIESGDARRFQQTIDALPQPKTVWIHMASRGGDVSESYALGRVLRQYHATVTHGYCASSCVFVYLGGSRRIFKVDNQPRNTGLWSHQPQATKSLRASAGSSAFAAKMLKELKDYTIEMTGDALYHDDMINISFESPKALSLKQAFKMKVSNEVYPASAPKP